MSSNPELDKRLKEGIALARTGQRAAARAILEEIVAADPYNETAWLWMAAVVSTNAERREALEIALEINPANREAREALNRLGGPRARRKAEEAQDIARRIGSDEVISEADFQPVIERPPEPEPEPEPELSPEEQSAALIRDLIAAARAEQAEAEAVPVSPLLGSEEAPEAEAVEEKVVEVYVPDVARARRWRWLVGAAMLLLAAAGIALAALLPGGGIVWWAATPTPDFATRLALLATDTPTYNSVIIVTGPPRATLLPATWTPSHTPSPLPSFTPSPPPPSPGSYSLVFSQRAPEEGAYRLATVRGDGTGLATLTPGQDDDRAPAPGPGGRRLLYITTVEGERQIALLLLPGPPEARRTATPTPDPEQPAAEPEAVRPLILTSLRNADRLSSPSWSPDGFRIVFSARVNGEEDIYLTDVEGASLVRLTANSRIIDRDPAWSPDGQTIVFVSDRDGRGQTELYCMRPDGTDVVRLTDSQGSSYAPAWSPDGRQIVFVSDRDRDADLYLMNADGSNEVLLTRNDDAEDRDPAWSPDGRWIVFSSNRESENFRLYLIDPYSGEILPVTAGADDAIEAAWLPEVARR